MSSVITTDRQKIDDRTPIRWSGRIETDGESLRRAGWAGGDPINSNGDEDIPNLSAIYREWAKYLRASAAQSALDEAMLIETRLHYSNVYTRARVYACATCARVRNLEGGREEKGQKSLFALTRLNGSPSITFKKKRAKKVGIDMEKFNFNTISFSFNCYSFFKPQFHLRATLINSD